MLKAIRRQLIGLLSISTVAVMLPNPASAQNTQVYGTIAGVFASNAHNEAFRIRLSNNGADVLSNCPYNFAYINADADNYQAYVALLTTLFVRGTPIIVTISPDGNGLCRINEFGT